MQTFLPYPNFEHTARVLDNRRLNKQIVECEQLCRALNDSAYRWSNHPAAKMWRGHYAQLVHYGRTLYREWQRRYRAGERGGKEFHKSGGQLSARYVDLAPLIDDDYSPRPSWLDDEFCSRHRAALLAKDPEWYGQFGWTETPGIDYLWPVPVT